MLSLHPIVLGALQYTEHRGYLPLGADLLNGTMTLDAAKTLCSSLNSCMGFTLSAASPNLRTPRSRHVVWLKSAVRCVRLAKREMRLIVAWSIMAKESEPSVGSGKVPLMSTAEGTLISLM